MEKDNLEDLEMRKAGCLSCYDVFRHMPMQPVLEAILRGDSKQMNRFRDYIRRLDVEKKRMGKVFDSGTEVEVEAEMHNIKRIDL